LLHVVGMSFRSDASEPVRMTTWGVSTVAAVEVKGSAA